MDCDSRRRTPKSTRPPSAAYPLNSKINSINVKSAPSCYQQVNAANMSPVGSLEQTKEPGSILFMEEYILACVSSEDDMVADTREMDAAFSNHASWGYQTNTHLSGLTLTMTPPPLGPLISGRFLDNVSLET